MVYVYIYIYIYTVVDVFYLYLLLFQGSLSFCMLKKIDPFNIRGWGKSRAPIYVCIYIYIYIYIYQKHHA